MARPEIEFDQKTAERVQALSQYGVPQEDIANDIDMSVETMLKLYREYWRKGKTIANTKIAERLFKKAMDGDTTAMIFWAKTQMGWSTTMKMEHSSPDGSMSPQGKTPKEVAEELIRQAESMGNE